jgi:ubiquinol-cytochrome c reductase iron-sulfur subunit
VDGVADEVSQTPPGERGEIPSSTELPSFPEHDPRLQLATGHPRRIGIIVGSFFVISFMATVALATTYVVGGQTQLEGGFLGAALASLGAGLISWGKYLLPQGPFVEPRTYEGREDLQSAPEDRRAFVGSFGRGAVVVGRRPFLLGLLSLAGAAFTAVLVFPLRSLGPQPKKTLFHTHWGKGTRMVSESGRPIKVTDMAVGSYMTVFPEGYEDDPQAQANDQVVLLHAASQPIQTKQGSTKWSPHGYLAFSKVCTHAGCPVSLYEAQVQQLLCPCHQSLFDVLIGAFPIFGPAPRPLPQLAIYADRKGYLRSQHGFLEPIGPGFWERGALPQGGYRT